MKRESPIRSMTGFGQCKVTSASSSYEIEMRSVNHRYLEISLKLPRVLSSVEYDLRALVSGYLRRGKLDLNIVRRPVNSLEEQGCFDAGLCAVYTAIYRRVLEEQGCSFEDLKKDVLFEIMRRPDIFRVPEDLLDIEAEKAVLFPAVESALAQLLEMRIKEGAALALDINERLQALRALHVRIEEASKGLPEKFRERIYSRVKRLEPEIKIEESRLAAELVLFCDRADVTEELVRLSSHFSQFEGALSKEGQGRKLDFISQEFLREFNTIASKAQDGLIQAFVVEAKTEVEKLKEQLQNIE